MLPGRHDPNVNILGLVRDWLQAGDGVPWLMILDNADDLATFFPGTSSGSQSHQPMASYLPKAGRGKILITSRNLNAAERLTGDHKAILHIPTMDSVEALGILERKLAGRYNEEIAKDLVRALDSIPLAVNQAAAYINRRTPRVSIISYLNDFRCSERQRSALLARDAGDIRRHESAANSIMLTWQLTFEQVRKERPAAADLLSLMSFFHPQSIPEFALTGYDESSTSHENVEGDDDAAFEDDLYVLRAYSLVSMHDVPGFLVMHPLVQFCTQEWLLRSGVLSLWRSLFLGLVHIHFPERPEEMWAACQIMLPHTQTVLREVPHSKADMLLYWASIRLKLAGYVIERGDLPAAEALLRETMERGKGILEPGDSLTLAHSRILAVLLYKQANFDEAEETAINMLEILNTKQPDHPERWQTMNILSAIYEAKNQPQKAERLLIELLDLLETRRGPQNSSTLETMHNLVLLYYDQGRMEEAESLMVEATMVDKTKQQVHPRMFVRLNFLAGIYESQDRLQEAGEIHIDILETCTKAYGADNYCTLKYMIYTSLSWERMGKMPEAMALMQEAMRLWPSSLGMDHVLATHAISKLKEWSTRE